MDRKYFLKSLGIGAAGMVIPSVNGIQAKPVKIYDNYIRGTAYYAFKGVRQQMKPGDDLVLEREAGNIHDSFAIAVFFQGRKLGYIPAYENVPLANMMDQGVELGAYVSSITKNGGDTYREVSVAVYAQLITMAPPVIENSLQRKKADDADDLYRKF